MNNETDELIGEVSGEASPEEYKEYNPKEIEDELIRQANERAADPGESAAQAYSMYVPHFKRLMPKMSVRGLRRVINYMVLYPLEQDAIKNANELEKQFMQLVNSLVEAKFIMIMDTYNQHAQELYDAQNKELTTEQETDISNELNKEQE